MRHFIRSLTFPSECYKLRDKLNIRCSGFKYIALYGPDFLGTVFFVFCSFTVGEEDLELESVVNICVPYKVLFSR